MEYSRRFAYVATALLLSLPSGAWAVPVDLTSGVEIYGGEMSQWEIEVEPDLCIAGSPPSGVTIKDAEFSAGTKQTDAFDGAHFLFVDESAFNAQGNIGNHTGATVSAGPDFLGGLTVSVRHTALAKAPTVRTLLRLKNQASTANGVKVSFHSNGGGDLDEDTVKTGDGDDTLEPNDAWVAWSPGSAQPNDPVKVTALAGPGKVREKVVTVSQSPGDPSSSVKECLAVDYQVRIPAKSIRYLLFFTRLEPNEGSTVFVGYTSADFSTEKPYLFKGMTEKEKARTLNWAI